MVSQKQPTILDVAKLANVSVATVSRVINQQGGVKKETEEKILQAIDELKYIRNAVARSMVMKETKTIGVIIPDINNPFFPLVVLGIEQKAREHGYFPILSSTNESEKVEKELINVFIERGVDGVIITTANEQGKYLKKLIDLQIPVVAVDRAIHHFEIDTVLVGNLEGAYQATRHLIQQGHRDIAIICGPLHTTPGHERYQGYKKALEEYGLPLNPEWIGQGDFRESSGFSITQEFSQLAQRPTAIFSSNNLMTIGCLKALQETDWLLGKDVSLIGFDDIEIATFINPKLTVVSRPMKNLGELAFQLLHERMRTKEPYSKRELILSPELKIRESCRLE